MFCLFDFFATCTFYNMKINKNLVIHSNTRAIYVLSKAHASYVNKWHKYMFIKIKKNVTQSCEINSKSCPSCLLSCKVLRNMHTQKAMISSKHFFALSLQSCTPKHLKTPFAWLRWAYVTQNQSSTNGLFPPFHSHAFSSMQSSHSKAHWHRTQERRTVQAMGHLPTPQARLVYRSEPRVLGTVYHLSGISGRLPGE